MIVRGLDSNGDWLFGKGRNDYKSKNAAIQQSIKTRLQSVLGDCFFDSSAGIDWFNLLGSKNKLALELAVRATILNTKGVTLLRSASVNTDASTRKISMVYVIDSIYTQNNSSNSITSTASFILTEAGDVLTAEDGSAIAGG